MKHSCSLLLNRENKQRTIRALFLLVGMFVYGAFVHLTGIHCPFTYFFKIYDPFDGTTRAFVSLLRGDIQLALWYHPLVLISPIFVMIVVVRIIWDKKSLDKYIVALSLLYFLVFIYRYWINPSSFFIPL